MNGVSEDYYEILGISRDADTAEVRRAYKKLALSFHPDKVPEDEREAAELRFKEISEAYEVLSDENERRNYDQFGKRPGGGAGGGAPFDDMFDADDFAQFFNFGAPPGGGGSKPRRKRRTEDAHIPIDVTLEEVFKGKVFKMESTRDVLCKSCSGTGGRPKATPRTCGKCSGDGFVKKLRRVGPGLVTNEFVECETCSGKGTVYRDKDKCKRCHGKGTAESTSLLEVYVPRGAPSGHKIVLDKMSDEAYGKETGDIIFEVRVKDHKTFERKYNDLYTHVTITLSEALIGFSRVLCEHLDGRGIQITTPPGKVLRPNDYLKVSGEGMPINKRGNSSSEARGDLYLLLTIEFPDDGWVVEKSDINRVKGMLPEKPKQNQQPTSSQSQIIDDVDYLVKNGSLPDYDEDYEDDEEDHMGGGAGPECTTM